MKNLRTWVVQEEGGSVVGTFQFDDEAITVEYLKTHLKGQFNLTEDVAIKSSQGQSFPLTDETNLVDLLESSGFSVITGRRESYCLVEPILDEPNIEVTDQNQTSEGKAEIAFASSLEPRAEAIKLVKSEAATDDSETKVDTGKVLFASLSSVLETQAVASEANNIQEAVPQFAFSNFAVDGTANESSSSAESDEEPHEFVSFQKILRFKEIFGGDEDFHLFLGLSGAKRRVLRQLSIAKDVPRFRHVDRENRDAFMSRVTVYEARILEEFPNRVELLSVLSYFGIKKPRHLARLGLTSLSEVVAQSSRFRRWKEQKFPFSPRNHPFWPHNRRGGFHPHGYHNEMAFGLPSGPPPVPTSVDHATFLFGRGGRGRGSFGRRGRGCRGRGNCDNKRMARLVSHKGLTKGASVSAGTTFTKVWTIRNDSDKAWPSQAKLVFIGGDEMHNESSLSSVLQPLAPGQSIDVSLISLVAPSLPGLYEAIFRLECENGTKIGQRLTCEIMSVETKA